ncbi:MAG: hypothetical protein KKA73_00630 [Chloroflexi bacterium]|nr:hypothetical protein [Chloroflexota bacterium]MBU1878887.1 hypothetical protein [Chloroflexota bacterium]
MGYQPRAAPLGPGDLDQPPALHQPPASAAGDAVSGSLADLRARRDRLQARLRRGGALLDQAQARGDEAELQRLYPHYCRLLDELAAVDRSVPALEAAAGPARVCVE